MQQTANQLVQAVPLNAHKLNVGAGVYQASSIIHAEVEAVITLHFKQGDEDYTIPVGEDRSYEGSFTVVSGTVTYA